MSKTPYEIRLELLKLANEILLTPVYQTRDAKLQEWNASRDCYANETAPRNPLPFPTLPDCQGRRTEEVCRPSVKDEGPERGFLVISCANDLRNSVAFRAQVCSRSTLIWCRPYTHDR